MSEYPETRECLRRRAVALTEFDRTVAALGRYAQDGLSLSENVAELVRLLDASPTLLDASPTLREQACDALSRIEASIGEVRKALEDGVFPRWSTCPRCFTRLETPPEVRHDDAI